MLHQTNYFHNLYRSVLLLMIFIGGGFLLPGAITPTFAATPTPTPSFPLTPTPPIVTGSIIPGFLTLVANAYSFSGTPGSIITYPMPFEVDDLRGGLLGWNLSITSTQFTSGTTSTPLPIDASLITGTMATCAAATTCSDASVTNTDSQNAAIPAAPTTPPGTPGVFFSTGAGKGAGTYTVTPTISVFIPGRTQIGTYTSTVTLAILTGP
jgi:hypothetical protein